MLRFDADTPLPLFSPYAATYAITFRCCRYADVRYAMLRRQPLMPRAMSAALRDMILMIITAGITPAAMPMPPPRHLPPLRRRHTPLATR